MEFEQMYRSMGVDDKIPSGPPNGGRPPKFVKLAGRDRGEGLPSAIFEDPRVFKPAAGKLGEIHTWGLYPYDDATNLPDFDGVAAMCRQMCYQMVYWRDTPSPEKQFVDILMKRKRKELASLDLKGLDKRDVILRISMREMDKSVTFGIWRRVRVSAGMKLSTFQDKVLAPVMGWVRNFHCYTLTDFRDGSLFGPEGSSSIDRMHIAQIGYDYLPDDKYNLAHIFSKEGDKFGYLYDFGDKWFHDIEVEHICSPEESNGEVVIIDGEGMCPGENMDGSWKYVENTRILNDGTPSEKLAKKREILQSPNYNDYKKSASQFNHKSFDLPLAISRLSAALGSSASVPSGAKVYHMPIMSGAEEIARGMHVKRGQKVEQKWDEENGGFWQETTSSTRDRRAEAVCAACGNPAGMQLKACSGCKQVLYCSRQHQYEHWKNGHKQQCSRKFSDKEKSAGSK